MENNDAWGEFELNPLSDKASASSPEKAEESSEQATSAAPFPSRTERKTQGADTLTVSPSADKAAATAASSESAVPSVLSENKPEGVNQFSMPPQSEIKDKKAKKEKKVKKEKAPKEPKPAKAAGEKGEKKSKRGLIAIIVGAALVVLAAAALIFLFSTNRLGNGGLAARVNGQGITTAQLDASVAKLKLQNPQVFEKNSGISAAQIRSALLDELINEQLIMQEAKNKGVTVTDKQVEDQVTAIKKQYGTQKQFDTVLKQQGYTLESLKSQLKYQLAAQGIAKKLVPDNSVSSKDAQDYFNANKKNYVVQAGKQVSQIKFALSDEAKANDVLAQIKGGGDFAQLAQKNSTDAASAARGGDLGWTPRNPPLEATLQEAVNGMNKGDVSDVIKSSTGLFILKVTDTREASEQPFSAVETTIKATLLNTKRNEASQNLLSDLRKKAKITIYDKAVKDYQAQKDSTSGTNNSTDKKSNTPGSGTTKK